MRIHASRSAACSRAGLIPQQFHPSSPWSAPLDFTRQIRQIQRNGATATTLLQSHRLVACFGNRALLNFFLSGLTRPGQVAGAATTEEEGLALIKGQRPDFLLVTDQLEEGCGIRLVERTKASHPEIRTLLMVGPLQRPARLRAAVEAGCDGLCLESGMGLDAGTPALRAIRDGGTYIDRPLSELLRSRGAGQARGPVPDLSAREIEVIELVVAGLKNNQIAARLFISPETVKSHLTNLLNKLGARDRNHAGLLALRLGLVDWPQEG